MEKYYLKKQTILRKKDLQNKEQKKIVQKDKQNNQNKKLNKLEMQIYLKLNKISKKNMRKINLSMIGVVIEKKYKQLQIGLNYKLNKRKLIKVF